MNIDVDFIKNLWLSSIVYSTILLLGMILYRYSVIFKIRESIKFKKKAYTDPLTGKGNRHKFLMEIDEYLSKKEKFAVCFMDLDGFKYINDTLGHDAGDLLLIELANLLEKNLPETCISYRIGGDEFAIIIDKVNTIKEISQILDNLKVALKEPIIIENTKIILEYSLGVAIYPTDGRTRNELIAYADDAMYYIKENGKNSYYFHNEALKAKLDNKKKMEVDLKKSLKDKDFGVQFQPRINLNNLDEVFLEALIYWNHPVLGKLNSEYFIKQAEETGIVLYLDEFVLRECCKKLVDLKSKGYKNVKMTINISNIHTKRHEFAIRLCDILGEYEIDRGDIQFEFANVIDFKQIESYKYLIDKLKEAGALICISNLEIKFESLKLFKELKIDEIKLSAGYIYDNSSFKHNLLKNIIDVCKDLNYLTTIICIENDKHLQYSLESNVNKIQGNYLFKKIEDEDLEKFFINYPNFKLGIEKVIKKGV